jgi:undecaprenyl-diphosphatase
VNGFDRWVLQHLNGWAQQSLGWDRFAVHFATQDLLKGGLFSVVLWACWFRYSEKQRESRRVIGTGVLVITAALLLNRVLASVLPFQARPMHRDDLGFSFLLPRGMPSDSFENLSSFPSDHAVLFVGLSVLLMAVGRRLGWILLFYVLILILLPRVYLGLHGPTDVLAGGLLGAAAAWLSRTQALQSFIGNRLETLEVRKPATFYLLAFGLTWMIADLFQPVVLWAEFLKSYWTN